MSSPVAEMEELQVINEKNDIEHIFKYNKTEPAKGLIGRYLTERGLSPTVNFNNFTFVLIDNSGQECGRTDFSEHDTMYEHFPNGGRVRLEKRATTSDSGRAEQSMIMRNNKTDGEARFDSLQAFKSRVAKSAEISDNIANGGSRQRNVQTDMPEAFQTFKWSD